MRTYHPNWQRNRVNFILKNCIPKKVNSNPALGFEFGSLKENSEFFNGKRILELGSFNGNIGADFYHMGADVTCVDGRLENVENIKRNHPYLNAFQCNLDTPDWTFGKFDIIINFGLFYHLENYHREHLKNCIENCDIMYFESVIYDKIDNDQYFFNRNEGGIDQSMSELGCTPTTDFVERIFKDIKCKYVKHCSSELNGDGHCYDWLDNDNVNDFLYVSRRRFWTVLK